MKWFWKTICLFAYRRWCGPSKTPPVGVPHNRDPDNECAGYEPGPRGGFDCQTDGHYLCKGCSHYRPPAYYDRDSEHWQDKNAPYLAERW